MLSLPLMRPLTPSLVLGRAGNSISLLCISHQTLSQLTPRMLGALGNTDTRMIFGIDRYDAEYVAKIVGRVDTEAVKREPNTDTQYELFSSTQEQWEQWYDHLRFQPPRQTMVMTGDNPAVSITTLAIPRYTATEEQVEAARCESVERYGVPYEQAKRNVASMTEYQTNGVREIPEYQMIEGQ